MKNICTVRKFVVSLYTNFKNYSCINSRQSAAYELSNEQIQVLITGKFGDGCLHVNNIRNDSSLNFSYSTNGIHKEYIEYKKILLRYLVTAKTNFPQSWIQTKFNS